MSKAIFHLSLAAILSVAPMLSRATVVTTNPSEFKVLFGQPTTAIDFGQAVLPPSADVVHFNATGEVLCTPINCVASFTGSGSNRTYTMRGGAWAPGFQSGQDEFVIRSGLEDGSAVGGGVGSGYLAHLWGGPLSNLRHDPMGGDRLLIEVRSELLGVYTTAGFFGWRQTPSDGLLALPVGAQITGLEYGFASPVSDVPSLLQVVLGLIGIGALRRKTGRV